MNNFASKRVDNMADSTPMAMAGILTVDKLLVNTKLQVQVPDYQRPYKWTVKNVNQLIDDILENKNRKKSEYRLGTLVVHRKKSTESDVDIVDGQQLYGCREFENFLQTESDVDIVDGQQRVVTLTLIAYAIVQNKEKKEELQKIKGLADFELRLLNLSFSSDISKENIQRNYRQIRRRIVEFDGEAIEFFLSRCTLVGVVLDDISEAFQFFDSQNARGKDLEPYDLLKAFHLRAMNNCSTEEERRIAVERWEAMDTNELSKLFSQYLFRIRNWSKGYSARYFTKNEVDVFKGINPDMQDNYPFAQMFRIAHFYVEEYDHSYHRDIDGSRMKYPFQIDQTIVNGKRFFEMVDHYHKMIQRIKSEEMKGENSILKIIRTYKGAYRTGDKYIRNLFYCALIYYIDRFGDDNIVKVTKKIFVWAYTLRLKLQVIRLVSVDNYALNQAYSQVPLFNTIKESIRSKDILDLQLETLKEHRSSGTDEIVAIFKELGYYE
jgi:hypothetical protein